jgi:hypothetical protein
LSRAVACGSKSAVANLPDIRVCRRNRPGGL